MRERDRLTLLSRLLGSLPTIVPCDVTLREIVRLNPETNGIL